MSGRKIVIFGNTHFAEMLKYYIEEINDYSVVGFTVDEKYIDQKYFCGSEMVPFEKIEEVFSKDEIQILPAIGYNQMNDLRKSIFYRIKSKGYKIASFIHPTATITNNCMLGEGNIFLENVLVQPFVKIGSGNIFWSNVNISHHSQIGDFNYFAPSVSLSGDVKMRDNCFLGNNCTIKNGIEVSSFTLIGAGSYVSKDTNEYSVIVPEKSKVLKDKISTNLKLL